MREVLLSGGFRSRRPPRSKKTRALPSLSLSLSRNAPRYGINRDQEAGRLDCPPTPSVTVLTRACLGTFFLAKRATRAPASPPTHARPHASSLSRCLYLAAHAPHQVQAGFGSLGRVGVYPPQLPGRLRVQGVVVVKGPGGRGWGRRRRRGDDEDARGRGERAGARSAARSPGTGRGRGCAGPASDRAGPPGGAGGGVGGGAWGGCVHVFSEWEGAPL